VLYKVHRIIPVSNIKTGLTIEGFAALVLIILHFTDYALRPPPIQHYLLKLWTNFDILVGLLGLGIGPLQGFCLQTKEQHRKTRAQVHASSGIRTNDLSGWTVQNYINLKKAASKTCTITTTTTTTSGLPSGLFPSCIRREIFVRFSHLSASSISSSLITLITCDEEWK